MSDYQNKSPEKSSPSFPEDDDDNVMDFDRSISPSSQTENNQSLYKNDSFNISAHENTPKDEMKKEDSPEPTTDLEKSTMEDNDYDYDPKQNSMTESDKKVHWSNENIIALLDCVESHLRDFSIHRKHKFVWQKIGKDMEHLGFNTEHCYNKWKNLRRDVRLLVNNPLKVVRNADILKRVARLILIIYPNVDAYTMQVNNDRTLSKSNPSTPNFKRSDSPSMVKLASYNQKTPTLQSKQHQNPPSTVLFTNIAPASLNNNMNHKPNSKDLNNFSLDLNNNNMPAANPLLFNPASFLVQSQMFNDLLKQQNIKLDDETFAQLLNNNNNTSPSLSNGSIDPNNNNINSSQQFLQPNNNNNSTTNIPVNSLASTLLNNIYTTTNSNNTSTNLLSSFVENLLNNNNNSSSNSHGNSTASSPNPILNCPSNNNLSGQALFDKLNLADEISGIVEKLRDEETVHLRLTEMITHLAEELRASGYRRQAILDKIANHFKINHGQNLNSSNPCNNNTNNNNNSNQNQTSNEAQQMKLNNSNTALNGQNCMEPVNSFG